MSQVGATAASQEETVLIGEGDRERPVRLKVFPGDGLVTVAKVGERPRYVGTVSALNLRRPQLRVEPAYASEFTKDDRSEIRAAADRIYWAALAALEAATPPEPAAPPILSPGRSSKYFTVDGLRLAFSPDVANRTVSIHTGIGSPRYIGQAREIGDETDDATKLWLKTLYWAARFGAAGPSQDITEAAGHVWRAARDEEGARGVAHG